MLLDELLWSTLTCVLSYVIQLNDAKLCRSLSLNEEIWSLCLTSILAIRMRGMHMFSDAVLLFSLNEAYQRSYKFAIGPI